MTADKPYLKGHGDSYRQCISTLLVIERDLDSHKMKLLDAEKL